jgi:hypothetical protein
MIDRLKYNSPKRLFKKPFELVSIINVRKYAERKKEVYYKEKGKDKARR